MCYSVLTYIIALNQEKSPWKEKLISEAGKKSTKLWKIVILYAYTCSVLFDSALPNIRVRVNVKIFHFTSFIYFNTGRPIHIKTA